MSASANSPTHPQVAALAAEELAYQIVPAGRATLADFASLPGLAATWGGDGTAETRRAFAELCIDAALSVPFQIATADGRAVVDAQEKYTALALCVVKAGHKRIVGIMCIFPRADYLLAEALAPKLEAYVAACNTAGIEPRDVGSPRDYTIVPSGVSRRLHSYLAGATIPLLATDLKAAPEVIDTLIKGVRMWQNRLLEEERSNLVLTPNGAEVEKYLDLAIGNGMSELAHDPRPDLLASYANADTSGTNGLVKILPRTVHLQLRLPDRGSVQARYSGLGSERYEVVQRIVSLFPEGRKEREAMSWEQREEKMKEQSRLYRQIKYMRRRDRVGRPYAEPGESSS